MRIIGGALRGTRLQPPKGLPVRPTSDMAKEALFNILNNRVDLEGLQCLDLFAGTGNVTFELFSRGAKNVLAVDIHGKCLQFIETAKVKLKAENIRTRKHDVFKYIATEKDSFDFIFADPPYDIPLLPQLPQLIFESALLNIGGWLVIEHPTLRQMEPHANYVETRKYGGSSFSFYYLAE